jgi:hypothetical protein
MQTLVTHLYPIPPNDYTKDQVTTIYTALISNNKVINSNLTVMEGTTAFASSTVSGHKLPITLT